MKTICLLALLLTFPAENCEDENRDRSAGAEQRAPMMPTDKAIALFESRVEKFDQDLSSRLVLGQLYLRRAKENDRFHDLLLAEKQFATVLKKKPNHSSAKILLSHGLLTQHRFKESLTQISDFLNDRPGDAAALAIQFDAQMQLGQYKAAKKTMDQLVASGRTPSALVRLASYHETFGEVDQAMAAMNEAKTLQSRLGDTDDNNAWYLLRSAQLAFDTGRIKSARDEVNAALKSHPDYPQALALLARIEWSEDQPQRAENLFKKSLSLVEEPPVLIAFGDFLSFTGRDQEAQEFFDKAETMMLEEEQDPISGPPHARERAVYFSNHNQRIQHAVKLATDDLEVRADIYTHDVLAWALHQAGQHQAALQHVRHAMSTQTKNATILFHAGTIEMANGNWTEGRDLLRAALRANPYFSKESVKKIREVLTAR